MKVFLLGLPKCGKSTIAKSLQLEFPNSYSIDNLSCLKFSFREINKEESQEEYEQAFKEFLSKNYLRNKDLTKIYSIEYLNSGLFANPILIDGIINPRDFISSFDYTKDIVVFLNRINNNYNAEDYQEISLSTIRDYCYWLASMNLLLPSRWLEYNYRIPGEESDFIKSMESKNSVFIVKSINKVTSHLKEILQCYLKTTKVLPQK